MAPQEHIPLAANVLGLIGTACWCVQLLPQIWYNWRQKKTEGLPGMMVMLWSACGVPFGVYAVVQNFNIPLQIQPQIFIFLALVCWAQTLYYNNGWKVWSATLVTAVLLVVFAGIEVLLILTLRGPYKDGVSWPITLVGVIAAVLLALGLIPPYFELAKRDGRVIGINFVFLAVDWSGAFFSLLSLVAQNTFDVLGGTLYIVCMLLEIGIFTSHWVWLYRTRRVRKAAKDAKMSYDDYVNGQSHTCTDAGASQETLSDAAAVPTVQSDLEKGVANPTNPKSQQPQENIHAPDPVHVKTAHKR